MKTKLLFTVLLVCVLLLIPAFLATPAQSAESIPEGLEYTVSNGEVTITDYTGTATELEIPSEIVGCPVTVIGDTAFQNCESLISILIPDGVTDIGSRSFENCVNLANITIPVSVCNFDYFVFNGCVSLENVYYEGTLQEWFQLKFPITDGYFLGSASSNPMCYASHLYLNGELLSGIVAIPEACTSVGPFTFLGCSDITAVVFHDNVDSISGAAFAGCSSLTKLYFKGAQPYYYDANSVEHFGDELNCDIHEWAYSEEDADYECFSGVTATAYYPAQYGICGCNSGFGGNIIWIPYQDSSKSNFTYIISSSEVTITGYTGTATELEIPSAIEGYPVTTIADRAFAECTTLEKVTVPSSVTDMGIHVFELCTSLEEVWLYCSASAVKWSVESGTPDAPEPDIMPDLCFCGEHGCSICDR